VQFGAFWEGVQGVYGIGIGGRRGVARCWGLTAWIGVERCFYQTIESHNLYIYIYYPTEVMSL